MMQTGQFWDIIWQLGTKKISIYTKTLKIGQYVCKLCLFKADFKHFTNKMCKINIFVKTKGFFQRSIDQFSKILCLMISTCSQLWGYAKKIAILTWSDVIFLHFMAENDTISLNVCMHIIFKSYIKDKITGLDLFLFTDSATGHGR